MRTNIKRAPVVRTHEGAPAIAPRTPLIELRRAVASCFLWENQFYESGVSIADRIIDLASKVPIEDLAGLIVDARVRMRLRHAPLLLTNALLLRDNPGPDRVDKVATIAAVIRRADEMGELISIYLAGSDRKTKPLPAALKRGVARAFAKFDAYQLGKYNRDGAIKLRDVLRIVHPKPADEERAALYKSILDGTLAAPDTWEVALSAGKDKKETFTRLINEGRLGYMALLRNLRKMQEVGVDPKLINDAILARSGARDVLPFRFVAAARAAPQFEPALDEALCASIEELSVLPGLTAIMVDVSQSMDAQLSGKSDLRRVDAAATLASIWPGTCRVFTFSDDLVEVPPRRGMAGVDAVMKSQPHHGTKLGAALAGVNQLVSYDRILVITDEESQDPVGGPLAGRPGYMINVASTANSVGYGAWTRIEGFSENVLRFVNESERLSEAS